MAGTGGLCQRSAYLRTARRASQCPGPGAERQARTGRATAPAGRPAGKGGGQPQLAEVARGGTLNLIGAGVSAAHHGGRHGLRDPEVQPAGRRCLLHRHLRVPDRRGGGEPGGQRRPRLLHRPAPLARRGEADPDDPARGGHPGDRGLAPAHGDHDRRRGAAGEGAAQRGPRQGRGGEPGRGGAGAAGAGPHPAVRRAARHLPGRGPWLPGHAAHGRDRQDRPFDCPAARHRRRRGRRERRAARAAVGAALRARRGHRLVLGTPDQAAALQGPAGDAGRPAGTRRAAGPFHPGAEDRRAPSSAAAGRRRAGWRTPTRAASGSSPRRAASPAWHPSRCSGSTSCSSRS